MDSKSTVTITALYGWKTFCNLCRIHGDTFCNPVTRNQLNRFRARYVLTSRFENLTLVGYSESAVRGYSEGIRLFMAYSAAELLGLAIGINIINWKIENRSLAGKLRKVLERVDTRKSELFDKNKLKDNLNKYINGETNNVRIAANDLRIMVAHGTFTPTGTDSFKKSGAQAISELSQCLLQECNRQFNQWLDQIQDNMK